MHDLFPNPFTVEVIKNFGGRQDYSFADGFLEYHHIHVAKEDQSNTTFAMLWGFFSYNVMPFGLKNAPSIFSMIVVTSFKECIHKFLDVYLDDWTIFNLLKENMQSLYLMLDQYH
jgi:hypothetical protein